jgi:hypothetical protein
MSRLPTIEACVLPSITAATKPSVATIKPSIATAIKPSTFNAAIPSYVTDLAALIATAATVPAAWSGAISCNVTNSATPVA